MERRKRRTFTREYKAEVVRLVRTSGKTIAQVARELDLGETAVRAWVQRADIDEKRDPKGPLTTEERAEVVRLRRELKTVTMERDFLRKAAVYSMDEGNSESREGQEASDADGGVQTDELFSFRKGSTLAAMEAGRIHFIDSQGHGKGTRNDSLVSDSFWWNRAESEAQKRQGANSG